MSTVPCNCKKSKLYPLILRSFSILIIEKNLKIIFLFYIKTGFYARTGSKFLIGYTVLYGYILYYFYVYSPIHLIVQKARTKVFFFKFVGRILKIVQESSRTTYNVYLQIWTDFLAGVSDSRLSCFFN